MASEDKKTRKLRNQAEKLRSAGHTKKALELYHELCRLEPSEPRWPHQAGELHRKLGELEAAIKHFVKAAEAYHKGAFDLKCVAMCKLILAFDPLNEVAQHLLEDVSGKPRPKPPLSEPDLPPVPPTTKEQVLAASGGQVIEPPPSTVDIPAVPTPGTPPARPAAKDQSRAKPPSLPRPEKQTLTLSMDDLEEVLEPPTTAPAAPSAPAKPLVATPPRPERSTAGSGSEDFGMIDLHIEVEDDEADQRIAPQPIPPPQKPRRAKGPSHATLLEEIDLELVEDGPPGAPPPTPPPRKPHKSKRPTLEPDAPLESLELRELLADEPGSKRRTTSSGVFEVPLGEDESGERKAESPRPKKYPRTKTPAPTGLFKALGIDELKSLVTRMQFVEKKPGEAIVKQDEVGGSLYVIVRGEVDIIRDTGTEAGKVKVSTLRDGEFFGEMALITDTPRLATVVAVTETELLEISRETMRLMIQDFPQVVPSLIKFLKNRLLEMFVKTSDLLKPVPEAKRWQLAKKFRLYEVAAGRVVIREGRPSGGLCIFLSGRARATRRKRGRNVPLAVIGPGEVVGEISLVTGGPAVATVTAASKVWMLAITEKQWQALTSAYPQMRSYIERIADRRREINEKILAGEEAYISQSLRIV